MPEWPETLDMAALAAMGWQPTPFREFVLKIHSRCNLSCHYCYVYNMADQSWRRQPKVISNEIADAFIYRLQEHVLSNSLASVNVVLHGGEPLLAGRAMIEYIADNLRSKVAAHVGISLQTNGILLNPDYLKLFDHYDIRVGVSLDGSQQAHDRHRRFDNGRGSYTSVIQGIELLASEPFRHLFSGLLCTIDPRNDPIETYEALAQFGPPAVDFLLPHGNWSSPPPGRIKDSKEAPYGDWLIRAFDHWYNHPGKATKVRLFTDIITLLLGGRSASEEVGLSPSSVAVIETDGSIEKSDILKSAYAGASSTGLHISGDTFDSLLGMPSIAARQIGLMALADDCRECELRNVCGGGMYAHRYRKGDGFRNPSVYCTDLYQLITRIKSVVSPYVAQLKEKNP